MDLKTEDLPLDELVVEYLKMFPERSNLKILLIDDDPYVGLYLTSLIGRLAPNMTLQQVRTVDEAEEQIESCHKSIDALIIDLRMGEKGGIELLQYMKSEKRYFPFVVYSGPHAISMQSIIVPVLREMNTRAAINSAITERRGNTFTGQFISKNDPPALLLLELLYMHHVFSEVYITGFDQMCEKLKPVYLIENQDEEIAVAFVESTLNMRNLLLEFLAFFESNKGIIEKGLNKIPPVVLNSGSNIFPWKETFTQTLRAYFLDSGNPDGKPLIPYTLESLNNIGESVDGFQHDLARYLGLYAVKGVTKPRNIISTYAYAMGIEQRDFDGFNEFPSGYETARGLLYEFNNSIGPLIEKLGVLGSLIRKKSKFADSPNWVDINKFYNYFQKRGLSLEIRAVQSQIYVQHSQFVFALNQIMENAVAAGGQVERIDIESCLIERLPHEIQKTFMGYKDETVLEHHPQVVSFTLYDNGPGFDSDLLEAGRYFDFHFSSTHSSGDGLAIIRKSMYCMKGGIELGNHKSGGYVRLYTFAK